MTEAAERVDGGMRSYELVAVVLGVLALALAAIVFIVSAGGDGDGTSTRPKAQVIRVVVPPGGPTGASLVPDRLAVRVGDSLVIENRDGRQHQVGPYVVGAGQTLRQTFPDPGTYVGACTVNVSGRVEIIVSPR